MKVLVVLDHPYTIASAENVPHRRSLSAAVAAAAIRGAQADGHEADLIDLAADGFQPAMTREDLLAWRQESVIDPLVLDYQQRLFAADHLAFVFPVWWEAMPAATKGFLDRVLTKGVMYEEVPGAKGNPFRNRMTGLSGVTVLSIMSTPDKAYRWWYRDPLTKILFKGTFAKIGSRTSTGPTTPASKTRRPNNATRCCATPRRPSPRSGSPHAPDCDPSCDKHTQALIPSLSPCMGSSGATRLPQSTCCADGLEICL